MDVMVIDPLREALSSELPGFAAQERMAPRPRPGWTPGRLPEDARQGAALVLLYPHRGRAYVVLTVRRRDLPEHPGQVSLPGGAREPDEDLTATALREAHEEIGVEPAGIVMLGALTPLHIPASGFVLHPIVGHRAGRPDLRAADGEVERILEIPIDDLRDPDRVRVERRVIAGYDLEVPFFHLDGEKVWGATAMILAELLWLLGDPPDPWGAARDGDPV